MESDNSKVSRITHFIHRHFVPLLIMSYVLAAVAPRLGLAARHITFGSIVLPFLGATQISLSLLMLSFLLFNAGLGIKTRELGDLKRQPGVLAVGFIANMLVPILLVFGLHGLMQLWHNADELQNLLVGLALIIAMPIAGSSASWSQNANGNLSLSLGLVLLSSMLSPLTTPLILHSFGWITQGDYSEDLHEMAQQGTNAFLCLTVVLPTLLGIATHYILGEKRAAKFKPVMKLTNFVLLLFLNYSNACTSLPKALASPDWDYLALILAATILFCSLAFLAGWLIAKLFRSNEADKASLMFGLGMNNNGTGLVLAATALADHPTVMLPMIFYTLVQQMIAALVDWRVFRARD